MTFDVQAAYIDFEKKALCSEVKDSFGIEVLGTCLGDSLVEFVIKNTASTSINTSWDFIIIEDVWLRESGTIQIGEQDSTILQFKSTGKNLKIQIPIGNAEGDTLVSEVENCGSTALPAAKVSDSVVVLELGGQCISDSLVRFSIKNTGTQGMTEAWDFIIIEDVWLREAGKFQLPSQDSIIFRQKATGETFKLLVPRANDTLSVSVNNCGLTSNSLLRIDSTQSDSSSLTNKKRQQAAIGLMAGTMGVGLSFGKSISKKWTCRINGTYLPIKVTPSWSYSELAELVIDAKSVSAGLLFDWYPSKKSPYSKFHLTGGAVLNFSEVSAYAAPNVDALINHPCKDEFVLGDARLTVNPQPVNPYAGIGFGRMPRNHKRIGIKFDLGVLYMGKPQVDLVTTGALKPTESQGAVIAENLSDYRWFPNANLTISYSFFKKR